MTPSTITEVKKLFNKKHCIKEVRKSWILSILTSMQN